MIYTDYLTRFAKGEKAMIQDLIENTKLTPQEKNIVDYMNNHPHDVMTSLSVHQQ